MSGKPKPKQLTLVDGKRPSRRAQKETLQAQHAKFFETLAESCNVTLSAREAGLSTSYCYRQRKRDAAFRASWEDAIEQGYAELELALLERAIAGAEKVTTYKDGSTQTVREYPNALAMSLLKMHRDTAREAGDREPAAEEVAEARRRIEEKLDRLAALNKREADDDKDDA